MSMSSAVASAPPAATSLARTARALLSGETAGGPEHGPAAVPSRPRVLVMAHNHPAFHPGGTEIFAHDLFEAYKRAGAEAMFVGATNRIHREPRPGTSFQAIGEAGDELVLWAGHFDRFNLSQIDLYGIVPDLVALLETFRPDVVHLHHLVLIGAEFPALVRRVLRDAQIVMTLHDYYPICAHDGLMVRVGTGERCAAASPHRCAACFPDVGADRFLLRERHLKAHLGVVDAFVSPSRFLKDRYAAWGLDEDHIAVIENGRPAAPVAPWRQTGGGRRASFGYFGNLNPWKGVTVLLEAAKRLVDQGVEFELRVHGGAPFQTDAFNAEIDRLFAETRTHVVRLGPYERADIPGLMAEVDWVVAPSVWWENAPLVIQEAHFHRRPVITSAIGGMAESVRDGVDGLHVPPGDPAALARTMAAAAQDPALWRRLAGGIAAPPTIDAVAMRHFDLFARLRGARGDDETPRHRGAAS
jgi:glycosyltransferase involved in cell wall biosynthesis